MESSPPVLEYTASTIRAALASCSGWDSHSQFDKQLCSLWDNAVARGVFRYTLDNVLTRPLPGDYGFVVQRNPKRFSHRRAPADMASLSQPFNPTAFNFSKAPCSEILLELRNETGLHWLMVNVSPIEYGHTLLVPRPLDKLPQLMTQDTIQVCLELVAMSNHRGFCMVANSLLAYASVNHLHYHFLYMTTPLLASRVTGHALCDNCYELVEHPSNGFGFQLGSSTADCAKTVFTIVSLLIEREIPHNLVMIRGNPFNDPGSPDPVIRVILIPRKPVYGLKSVYESGQTPLFFPAACELGLGFIPIVDQSRWDSLTEQDLLSVLKNDILPQSQWAELRAAAVERLKQ